MQVKRFSLVPSKIAIALGHPNDPTCSTPRSRQWRPSIGIQFKIYIGLLIRVSVSIIEKHYDPADEIECEFVQVLKPLAWGGDDYPPDNRRLACQKRHIPLFSVAKLYSEHSVIGARS